MPATTGLMTVDEFRQRPETGPFYYELRHGELVQATRPKKKHAVIQKKISRALELHAGEAYWVQEEMAFRPLPEYELHVVDVGAVTPARWEQTDPDENLAGAPDLVVEVISPSNTMEEILEKRSLCLENGCREFWVVEPKFRVVNVSTVDGITRTYRGAVFVPLALFGDARLPVAAIFE